VKRGQRSSGRVLPALRHRSGRGRAVRFLCCLRGSRRWWSGRQRRLQTVAPRECRNRPLTISRLRL
jgi:hypothetical protein